MTAIGEHLSPLLMSEIIWPNRLLNAVGHTAQRLDIWVPQVDMDLAVLCGDDTGIRVSAVGLLILPAAPPLQSLAEDSRICNLCGLWRTGPDC